MALIGAAIMALLYNFEAELGPIFVSAPRKEVVLNFNADFPDVEVFLGSLTLQVYACDISTEQARACHHLEFEGLH